MITRRCFAATLAAAAMVPAAAKPSHLSLEGYIFQNLASREKKLLADLLEQHFAAAAAAGFQNIELNDGFFTPALRGPVIALTRANHLLMPSVYVGGTMHDAELADKTI